MSTMSQEPREKLREILAKNGDALLQDRDRTEGLLKDHCGAHRREVSALVGALEERIPLELKSSWQSAMTPEAMRARLVQRLEEHRGLAHDVAEWAVDSWSYAVGVGLGRASDRLDSVVISGAQPQVPLPPPHGAPQFPPAQAAGLYRDPAEFPQQPQYAQPQYPQAQYAVPQTSNPQQQASQPQMSQPYVAPAPVRGWTSQQKAGAAVAAALVIAAVAYSGKLTPTTQVECGEGQQMNAAGQCEDAPKKEQPKPRPAVATGVVLAKGSQFGIAVNEPLNSDTATVGQYVAGTLSTPIVVGGKTMIPAGSRATLQITEVDSAGQLLGRAQIKLVLVSINNGGKKLSLETADSAVKGPSKTISTAKKTGIAAGVGCAVGGAIGKIWKKGGVGCAAGAGAGGATGVALSSKDKPKPAQLAAGTVMNFSLTQPLSL